MDLLKDGDTYGMWRIISFSGEKMNRTKNTYLCECQCHYKTRKIMRKDILLSGNSKSCKYCSGFKDLVGNKYGKLTVKELDLETTLEKNKTYWFCSCECGNITSVRYDTLQEMTTTSCGCLRDEHEDLTGNKYGSLTIIRYSHKKDMIMAPVLICGFARVIVVMKQLLLKVIWLLVTLFHVVVEQDPKAN